MKRLHPEKMADMRARDRAPVQTEPCWVCRLALAAIIGFALAFVSYLAWSLLTFSVEAATVRPEICRAYPTECAAAVVEDL